MGSVPLVATSTDQKAVSMTSAVSRYLAAAGLAAAFLVTALAQAQRPLDPALPDYLPQPVHVNPTAGYLAADGALRIGGAEHVQFIVERFNQLFTQSHPNIRFKLEGQGTTSAVPLLMFDKTLFAPMGRAINPIEAVPFRKIVGRDALEIRVAHTADDTAQHLATSLAVYVNRANPVTALSATQVARMLSIGNPDGDYSTWGQLGLKGDWARRPIHPYGTAEYSGFGDYLQQNHLEHRQLALRHEQQNTTETILKAIAADPAGVGVAAIGLQTEQVRQVAMVGADGTLNSGTPEQVTASSYPYGRALYFYVRRLPGQAVDPLVKEYLRLVLSREGQAIIASQDKGYLPLTAAQAKAELAKLD